jgi:hypothetical protein
MPLLFMQFSQPPVTSFSFDPNILLNILFSNTLSLLKCIFKKIQNEVVEWIQLAENRASGGLL